MRSLFPTVKRPLWTRAVIREKPGVLGGTQTLSSCSEKQVAWLYLLPDSSLRSLLASKLCLALLFSEACDIVERDGALQTDLCSAVQYF